MGGSAAGWWALVLAVSGCSFDRGGSSGTNLDAGLADSALSDGDAPRSSHLLLSEVTTGPPTGEFVEVLNPTCQDAPLRTYYLTDDPSYPLLPALDAAFNPGYLDAILRFPPGATLASGQVAVVARDGAAFETLYGRPPDFAVTHPGSAEPMEIVAHGSTSDMELANSGEPVVLFFWDDEADLVRDVDMLIAGEGPAAGRRLVAKQDLAPDGVDGPDADGQVSLYAPDAASLPPMEARDAVGGSYQRIVFEDVFEVAEGGNGMGGHDETSEDTRTTWEQDVGTAPTPGEVAASLAVHCQGAGS